MNNETYNRSAIGLANVSVWFAIYSTNVGCWLIFAFSTRTGSVKICTLFFCEMKKKSVMSLNDNKFSIKSTHKPCLSNLGNIDECSGLCNKPFFHDCNWCYTDFLVALSNDLPCPCHLIAHSNHKMWPIVRRICNDLWIRAFY